MPEGNVSLDRSQHEHTCLTAAATTGAGTAINVSEYKTVVISVATDGGADYDGTFKVQGTSKFSEPTWDSAVSVTNFWTLKQMIDLDNGLPINGSTGKVVAGADLYREYEVNLNGAKWINVNQTVRNAGELTAWITPYKNS